MKYDGLPIRFDVRAREKRQGNVKDLWKPATRSTGGRQGRRKEDADLGKKEKVKEAQRRIYAERSLKPKAEGTDARPAGDRKPAPKKAAAKLPAFKKPDGKRPQGNVR